jgi:Protein of unknown function (DUF3017)
MSRWRAPSVPGHDGEEVKTRGVPGDTTDSAAKSNGAGDMMELRRRLTERIPVHGAITVVWLIALAGFVRVLAEHWREGTGLIGGALLVAAVSRVVLPDDRAGLLAVRSQAIDVLCYLGFGMLMLFLAATIPRTPFIHA